MTAEVSAPLGPVSVLDIGGDVGAAVVCLSTDTPTGELYACPRGKPEQHLHTGVHLRPMGDGEALVAVFPELVEGQWSLLRDGVEHTPFDVIGGAVAELAI